MTYLLLGRYFIFNGQPGRAYYRNLPFNEKGKKDGTNCEMIINALNDLGYENYYKDYWYICHYYFGWAVPTVKHLKEKVHSNISLIIDQ